MGWDGAGSITLLYDFTADRDAGTPSNVISATKFDTLLDDLATAIELCVNREGENAAAANISWGGYKITSLGDPTVATDAINASSVAENTIQYGGTTGGSSNAYTVTNAFIATVGTGTRLLCLANHTNTGAATINVNAAGAVAVVQRDGSTALTGGEIVSGDFFEVAYDGTSWVLVSALDLSQVNSLSLSYAGNLLTLTNTSDSASVQVAALHGDRATMADNDEAYVSMYLSDDGGTQTEMARLSWVATDVTNATEDGELELSVMVAGTLTDKLRLSGAALYPKTNDSMTLGTSSLGFSDAYLADGGRLYFDSAAAYLEHVDLYDSNAARWVGIGGVWSSAAGSGTLSTDPLPSFNVQNTRSISTATHVGEINFWGQNDGASEVRYGNILSYVAVPTAGAETSRIVIKALVAGAEEALLFIAPDRISPQLAGIDLGSTSSATEWANLYLASGAEISWNESGGGTDSYIVNDAANTISVLQTQVFNVEYAGIAYNALKRSDAHGSGVVVSQTEFYGKDSAGNDTSYGSIAGYCVDDTNLSEDGRIQIGLRVAGAFDADYYVFTNTNFNSTVANTVALGSSSAPFADLFLGSGGVINWNNGTTTLDDTKMETIIAGVAKANNLIPNPSFRARAIEGGYTNASNAYNNQHIAAQWYTQVGGYTSGAWTSVAEDVSSGVGEDGASAISLDITTGFGSVATTGVSAIRADLPATRLKDELAWGTANAKDAKLGFYLKSSVTGVHSVSLRNSTDFVAWIEECNITSADTWQWFEFTVPGPTSGAWALGTENQQFGIRFIAECGSNFLEASASTGVWNTYASAGATLFASDAQVDAVSTTNNQFAVSCPIMIPADYEMPAAGYRALACSGNQLQPNALGPQIAINGAATFDLVDLPREADYIEVQLIALSGSSTGNLYMQVISSGSAVTSGYVGRGFDETITEVSPTTYIPLNASTPAAADTYYGTVRLTRVGRQRNRWTYEVNLAVFSSNHNFVAVGNVTGTTYIDGLRFGTDSGTLDGASTIVVYHEARSNI